MKFFISVVIILVALTSGYVISARRYTAIGCGIAMKWGDRANTRVELLLMVIAIPPVAILVYGPVMWFYTLCKFNLPESRLAASAVIFLAVLGYGKLLCEMIETGAHNGKIRAERDAKRNKRNCEIACEYASWGETILECQNPTCLNCPLMGQYDIKARIYQHDVLESIYRHERIERTMRRRSQAVPMSYPIEIPIERVLTKVLNLEGWYDPFAEDIFATVEEPTRTEASNIIPFPVQPKVKPELEPVALRGEVIENKPTPARRRAKCSKVVFSRSDRGVKVEDHGTYLSVLLAWTDEAGARQCQEYTLDKTSPDCLYLVDEVAAIDLNAALQLQTMAIPAEKL